MPEKPLKVIYIAGPFRADSHRQVEKNIRCAEDLAQAVMETEGLFPVCVHSMLRHVGGSLEKTLEGDKELLRRSDAVLVLPDWESSVGTTGEVLEAIACGMPVFEATDFTDMGPVEGYRVTFAEVAEDGTCARRLLSTRELLSDWVKAA